MHVFQDSLVAPLRPLEREQWEPTARTHERRAGRFADPFLDRRNRGQKHPVEDFLFTYYTLKPGQFKKWHPGAGVILLDAPEYAAQKFYRPATAVEIEAAGVDAARASSLEKSGEAMLVDVEAFLEKRGSAVEFTREILGNTAAKPGFFGCFGMHEWAMAYKSEENNIRHEYLQLRLGSEGTNQVVENNRIRCSHFDAFRFFMPQAIDKNELQPTREQQRFMEQPACLHANMDVYKWAYKLLPLVDSELLMDCFELAWEIRELDMKAAPYELRDWGYEPIEVETPAGKAEYVKIQRGFSERSVQLRRRLVKVLDDARTASGTEQVRA
ncbi:3-methyladenine DNA glycosylase [Rothia amarae]|uniref:3-methyladenine DNA glycosylase n=1 Tax=Rothia amarae TaxID=169480 RepID=UPI0033EB0A65